MNRIVGEAETLSSSVKSKSYISTGSSDNSVCSIATVLKGKKRYWDDDPMMQNYVKEAKRRGLSCDVNTNYALNANSNSSSSKSFSSGGSPLDQNEVKQYFKRLKSYQRKAIQQVLYMNGLYMSSIDGIWGKRTFAT